MGLRDLFRKHKKRHNRSPCSSNGSSTKSNQIPPPPPLPATVRQRQQHTEDKNDLTCLDVNATA